MFIGRLLLTTFIIALSATASMPEESWVVINSTRNSPDGPMIASTLVHTTTNEDSPSVVRLSGSLLSAEHSLPVSVSVEGDMEQIKRQFNLMEQGVLKAADQNIGEIRRAAQAPQNTAIDGVNLDTYLLQSRAGQYSLSVTDDPHPLLVPLVVAGAVLAVCEGTHIYNQMAECRESSLSFTIKVLGMELSCEAACGG